MSFVFIFNNKAILLAEDVFITRTGKCYYNAASPFVKMRATIRIRKEDAEAKGYRPSKSYIKKHEKDSKGKEIRFFDGEDNK